ncbi:MAG: hypothetical protein IJ124_02420 [Clostridia bacterium]|nr:hypothetical protein [Clostridia bacterium]
MSRKVLLIEPDYKNKYPPMGLMKIATYFRRCGDDVRFFKGDLRHFAAQLLCEEYLQENNEHRIKRYYPNLLNYIKHGHLNDIDVIPDFMGTSLQVNIQYYHMRYVHKEYPKFDFIGVTTLFTFYWKKTVDTINQAKQFLAENGRFMVGGIASTILPEQLFKDTGVHPHLGLLDKPGDIDEGNPDIIDELPLDYSILHEVDYRYPVSDAYFGYMTRGCPRNCTFCAVKTLEPNYKDYIGIKDQLQYINKRFGVKRDLLLMDNNVFASKCFAQIIGEIKKCGFEKGSKYVPSDEYVIALQNLKEGYNIRAYLRVVVDIYNKIAEKLTNEEAGGLYLKREELALLYAETATVDSVIQFDALFRPFYDAHHNLLPRVHHIDFNQGLDARLATDAKMAKLSEICIKPLRIAFDHYEQRDTYCRAIRLAAAHGITDMSNYLLYNFEDTPEELYYRMKINVDLCQELGVKIYSFPMKYHPIRDPEFFDNRDYIGKRWNRKFIRTIQCILNSTKGKVGANKAFFEQAFGRDVDEFHRLLWMPEEFILFRSKYDAEFRARLAIMNPDKYTAKSKDGSDLANEWWDAFNRLDPQKLEIAKAIISTNQFDEGSYECDDDEISSLLEYYRISSNNAPKIIDDD